MTLSIFQASLRQCAVALTAAWIGAVVCASASQAKEQAALSAPTQAVVLSIQGDIQNTNIESSDVLRADFDMAMLMAMPAQNIDTTTPWTQGVVRFEGVSVTDILGRVAAKGVEGEFSALNDYTVRIPLEDLSQFGAIIAYRMNGELMRVRDKGPLWVIYPLDTLTQPQSVQYHDRMIWQLRSIIVK